MLIALNDDVAVDPKKVIKIEKCEFVNDEKRAVNVLFEEDSDGSGLITIYNTTVAEVTAKINAAIENEILLRAAK